VQLPQLLLPLCHRAEAWACSGRGAAICVRVFSSVSVCFITVSDL
jgi:hypothetical protein